MSQPLPADVEGVAFGDDFAVIAKADVRRLVDLDERIERRGLQLFGPTHNYYKELWREGRIDLAWSASVDDVIVYFTPEQKKAAASL